MPESTKNSIFLARPKAQVKKSQPWKKWHTFVQATESGEELIFAKDPCDNGVNLGGY